MAGTVAGIAAGPARTVAVIGVGRAGSALGAALAAAGHEVSAFYTRSPAGRERAAERFPTATACATPAQAAAAAEVILLGVPDDLIETVAAQAAPGLTRSVPGGSLLPLVAHLSGRHGIAPLAPARAVGARTAAIHPIMTLTGTPADVDRLTGATFGVTTVPGDEPAAALVRRLVTDVGGRVAVVPEEQRPIYHAALVLGGNFLATLVTAAGRLIAEAGVPDPAGALGPLLRASLENALDGGAAAMTGPVRRGDVGTVTAQLAGLEALDRHLADAYAALAVLTADRLEQAGLLEPPVAAAVRAAATDAPAAGDRGWV
ncbi:Rossmann-like and DUF2520 domain-containing protein [Parafrankia discariae]|uniref:Rossmann-like and DUF2520 domain-containing protein n=1 Tax=Parafrankia discariae TaxID=365528 RepID=UPI0006840300|nr:Rossmann-like and DUF2520 domain-containing protein [Parafrankia discariae]